MLRGSFQTFFLIYSLFSLMKTAKLINNSEQNMFLISCCISLILRDGNNDIISHFIFQISHW